MANWNRISTDQRHRIITYALAGKQPALIVREPDINADITVVYTVLSQARREGIAIQKFSPRALRRPDGLVVRVFVPDAVQKDRLEKAADAREMSRSELVNRLVATLLKDDMVDAILDDGVNSNAA